MVDPTIMTSYKSGQVSAKLFANTSASSSSSLASLFATKPKPALNLKNDEKKLNNSAPDTTKSLNPKKKKKKEKIETEVKSSKQKKTPKLQKEIHVITPNKIVGNGSVTKGTTSPVWSAPFLHESLQAKPEKPKTSPAPAKKRKLDRVKEDEKDETSGKRPRRDRLRDKGNDNRTIFVGNCPLSADKKVLKSLFKEYGDIESIRFRCAPPADPNLPRRAIVITKNFHEKGKNIVAYIVFKEETSAKKALVKNGHLLDGLHLRVDMSTISKKHDKKRSIFVGNLPFDITEEQLWNHFEDCGDITNIRLVRDRQTSLGKGIGYVQFESKDSVSLALKLNKTKVEGREVRVMVCTNKDKDKDKPGPGSNKKKGRKEDGDKKSRPKPKRPLFAPSNSTGTTFKAKLQMKKEKRIRQHKKKKEMANKSDGLAPTALTIKKKKMKSPKPKKAHNKDKKNVKKTSGAKGKKPFSKGKGQSGKGFKGKDKNFKKKS